MTSRQPPVWHQRAATAHRTIAGIYAAFFGIATILGMATATGVADGAALILVLPGAFFVALHISLATAAEDCRSWARDASIVVGALMLLLVPVGTVLGAWLLYNSVRHWTPPTRYSGSLTDGWPGEKP